MSHHSPAASLALLAAVLASATASSALAFGPSWEGDLIDDAKGGANTAQPVSTGGPITSITGTLGTYPLVGGGPDVIDMYLIRLENPGILKMSTVGGPSGGSAGFDSQLFLFRAEGIPGSMKAFGLLANNDANEDVSGSFVGPAANDGSGFIVNAPGLYFIAITAFGTNPFTTGGDPIWGDLNVPGQIRFGNQAELAGWNATGQSPGGNYTISISGFSGQGVPAPGAVALLAIGGLTGRLSRRRR
jgi:hypothetical protein